MEKYEAMTLMVTVQIEGHMYDHVTRVLVGIDDDMEPFDDDVLQKRIT
jgi:hypothetical protein